MVSDLVPSHSLANADHALTKVGAATIFGLSPRDMITHATEIANVLRDVIVKQKLDVRIGGSDKPHVKAEGWATLGVLLGILPREKNVKRLDDGSYEAYVDLVSQSTGMVVGGASSLCSKSESRWGKADEFARRSMAITRATGKAYRLSFGWIMHLAGYSPTPAEEMPDDARQEEPLRPSPRKPGAKQNDPDRFDPQNNAHCDRLEAALKNMGVIDEDLQNKIAVRMTGKLMLASEIKAAKDFCELPFS